VQAGRVTFADAAAFRAVADRYAGPQAEQERRESDEAYEEGGQTRTLPPLQLIEKLLLTENALPPKGGTRAARKCAATQAPVGVPSKGAPETDADCAAPLGANTTTTRAVPMTSPRLQG
jgi:hypothetical protein